MKQRVPARAWRSPRSEPHRPRVLVEDDDPALAISDFSLFEQAGLDVALCSGPERGACPVLRDEPCPVLEQADVVLHGLDPDLGIAEAIRRQHPDLPVLVARPRGKDGTVEPAPGGCIPLVFPCSVRGQIAALQRALRAGGS